VAVVQDAAMANLAHHHIPECAQMDNLVAAVDSLVVEVDSLAVVVGKVADLAGHPTDHPSFVVGLGSAIHRLA
jgi:hypothetical protein